MAYLNLDLDYFEHPKTRRLIGLLGPGAELLPIRLWSYCGKHHVDGILKDYSGTEIESVAGWTGESGKMIDAMMKVKFLEKCGEKIIVHDWNDHAGHLMAFKKRAKLASKRRWESYATSIAKKKSSIAKSEFTNAPQEVGKVGKVGKEEEEGGLGETKWPSASALVDLYNKTAPDECPAVSVLSPARKHKANAYLKLFPDQTFWEEVFKQITASKFLRGLANSNGHKGFIADFDWILTKGKDGTENAIKVHDGKYHD